MNKEGNAMVISKEECVTLEDQGLLHSLGCKLAAGLGAGEKPQLLRDIIRIILDGDERKLRLVYFFAKGLK